MFDIGFSELLMIGVVALIVIGPERLPKVARTAGHLYGRMQRYVSSVKTDISNEIHLDEIRKAGEGFKESVESAVGGIQRETNVVDDYMRSEVGNVSKVMAAMAVTEGDRPVTETAMKQLESEDNPQQSLLLEEPARDADMTQTPSAVIETARGSNAGTST
ncbi:MAG: Sec-independent protein translocase protein TatB [Thiobacillus sp.]